MSPARRARLLAWLPSVLVTAYLLATLADLPSWALALVITVGAGAGILVIGAGWEPRQAPAGTVARHPAGRDRMDASSAGVYVPAEWVRELER